ncbi:MAG TPA: hypothetical protein VFH97_05840, partial [Gemmatimonadales bacterium]|nr:hypothetical protein [Gemmatimonadales bacterium]
PGTGAPAAAGQTVVIQGGRIRLVGATDASPSPTDRAADSTTQVIDGTGRYLTPACGTCTPTWSTPAAPPA